MPIASKNINAEKIQGNLDISSVSASAFTGSFIGDGAGLYNLPTQSFDTSSLVTTSSFNAFTASYATGSFTGSFTGSLQGTASYALTASYLDTYIPPFPYTGSAEITGSLTVTGSTNLYNPGATVLSVAGAQGEIFSVTDDTSGDLLVVQSGSTDILVVSASGQTTLSGSLTVTDSIYSSKLAGTGSLYLQPNKNDVRFLEIYNTSPQDTHITASGGWLYLGNDETYVQVNTYGSDKTIQVRADNRLTVSGSMHHSGTFYPDQIDWFSSSIGYDTGSYILTTTINGLTTYANYQDVAAILNSAVVLTSSFNSYTGSNTSQFAGTASYASNAATASNILGGKATHVPYFITDTTLATSSIFQSGSATVIINQDNATTANPEALYVWQPSTSSINVISGKGNLNNYLQLNIQNTNQGTDASSDIVATANNGSETDNYIDMGINSENYAGFLGGPNDSYVYSHGHNMWIGNINDGYDINFFNSSSQTPIIKLTADGQAKITGSLHGTASWAENAISSSYAVTASYASNVPLTASYAISSSQAVNANNSDTAISASHAITADTAIAANYAATAGNGGVTQIIAGSGITLLPPAGTGAVTVIASAGGGVTIISGSLVTGSFVNTTSYTFNHNLNTRTPIITVFDSNYNQIIPENIQLVDTASAIITFPTLESGFAIGSTGGTTGTALSSSYSVFSTYADTASYFSGSITNAVTASYALFAETASSALNAQDILIYVQNNSGYNIAKGAVVHITASGNSSDIPRIVTASYENDNNSANTLGITNQSIANGALGYVMTEGVLKGINTSNFTSGQLIYLGATGSIIGTAPVAPLHAVRLGQVVREQSNNGSIYISINNGYEIGELHDVRDTTTTGSYGDLLVKSGSIWTNSKQLTGSYAVTGSLTVSGSGTFTNIGPAAFTGSVGISGSQTFYGTSAFYGNHTLSGSNTITGDTIMSGSIEVSGSSNFKNSLFIVTGSTYFKGTHEVSGSTTITGSLNVTGNVNIVSGSSFTRWGNKLFNYGQFANTSSISITQNVSASVALPLMYFNDGVSIVSGSRITFANTGLYNIQYSALALQGNTSPNLRIWFRKTGSNVDNSSTIIQLQNNSQTAVTSQFAQSINAGEYVELWYHSNGANTSFPYTAAASGFPAAPSIIVTVTQIA